MIFELSDTERSLIREGLDCLKYMLYTHDAYYKYSEETKKDMYINCNTLKNKLNYE